MPFGFKKRRGSKQRRLTRDRNRVERREEKGLRILSIPLAIGLER